MNFHNALLELCHGNGNTLELARKHRLDAQQVAALEATSKRVLETVGILSFPNSAISMQ